MGAGPRSRFASSWITTSLRVRVALGVALPVLLVMASLSTIRFYRSRHALEGQIQLTVLQLGEVIMGSLRHAMLSNDREALTETLADVGNMEIVRTVQIIDPEGEVKAASSDELVGAVKRPGDLGCVECHRFEPGDRPRTAALSAPDDTMRISMSVTNDPDCVACHQQEDAYLGALLLDVSVSNVEGYLRESLGADLMISVASAIVVTLAVYLLIHWQVVHRVESFRRPLTEFAAGDFTARLPEPPGPADELGELAGAFNRMADQLDRHVREREERARLRQQAIVEERERIARELHDRLAQLLGYVNTKAMAVRLMVKSRQIEAAEHHLSQLEEAARELFVDVREVILDLRVSARSDAGLADTLGELAAQFSRLSGLAIEFTIAPEARQVSLPAETELQLLRIAQESLTNVRKHAAATRVRGSLQLNGDVLELQVCDDGVGFDCNAVRPAHWPHFGLSMMRERARAIGAEFTVDSEPEGGTRVTVRLAMGDPTGPGEREPG